MRRDSDGYKYGVNTYASYNMPKLSDLIFKRPTHAPKNATYRPQWQSDDTVELCVRCRSKFSALRRRHHCRACGNIFCSSCAKRFAKLPARFGYVMAERTCEECYWKFAEVAPGKVGKTCPLRQRSLLQGEGAGCLDDSSIGSLLLTASYLPGESLEAGRNQMQAELLGQERQRELVLISLTNYRVILKSLPFSLLGSVPLASICQIERHGQEVVFTCYDSRTIRARIFTEEHSDSQWLTQFVRTRASLLQSGNKEQSFAFSRWQHSQDSANEAGWHIFDMDKHFEQRLADSSAWRINDMNASYEVCKTYPATLVLPKLPNGIILRVAEKYSHKRFPVLCWRGTGGQCILRCARLESSSDETEHDIPNYLQAVANSNPRNNTLYVVDCGDRTASVHEIKLEFVKTIYAELDDHVHISKSFNRLHAAINSRRGDSWLYYLDTSGWLQNIRRILTVSINIVRLIKRKKSSVIIQSLKGKDRASQVSGVVQVLLDHRYRTCEGLEQLIEKEWCSFGYPFAKRFHVDKEWSVGFLQWIECIYQLLRQFPHAFEFNEHFLAAIIDAVYTSRFGTFLYNSERSRVSANLSKLTKSAWAWLNAPSMRAQHLNKFYRSMDLVLAPNVKARSIKLWENFWLRWDLQYKPSSIWSECEEAFTEETRIQTELALEVQRLTERLQKLKSEAMNHSNVASRSL